MHKYEQRPVLRCAQCYETEEECECREFIPTERQEMVEVYYCDVCGREIEYDASEKDTFGFRFPIITHLGMDKDNRCYITGGSGGSYHFHRKCFKSEVKPCFLKRVKSRYGEVFLVPKCDEEEIVNRLGAD